MQYQGGVSNTCRVKESLHKTTYYMIPFIWSSRTGKSYYENKKGSIVASGVWMIMGFWGDCNISCFSQDLGCISIRICEHLFNENVHVRFERFIVSNFSSGD